MNPVLRGSAAHVFVDSLAAPQLSDDDDHHLRRVLRVRESEAITVGDGAGGWVDGEADGRFRVGRHRTRSSSRRLVRQR